MNQQLTETKVPLFMTITTTRKLCTLALALLLSAITYAQYGVIEMNNGDQHEMASPELKIERDLLRYFIEEFKPKASVMGFGYKKLKKEYLEKSRLLNIADIKKVHVDGELLVGSRSVLNFNAVRYIKIKRRYREFYVLQDGECRLLVKPENGNALYSYFVQTGTEEPFKLHQVGTGFGAKFRKKSKKYFANCKPAMDYIEKGLKRETLPKLIDIFNANCAE